MQCWRAGVIGDGKGVDRSLTTDRLVSQILGLGTACTSSTAGGDRSCRPGQRWISNRPSLAACQYGALRPSGTGVGLGGRSSSGFSVIPAYSFSGNEPLRFGAEDGAAGAARLPARCDQRDLDVLTRRGPDRPTT